MNQTKKYLETVINQCIAQCIVFSDSNKSLFGLELAFLLHYLNPKTYQTKHVIDNHHAVESPSSILQSTAHHLLKSTLCQFQLRDSLVQYVQHIVKLQNRSLQQEAQRLNTMTLWVATVTRLTLYPIDYAETAPGSLDMNEALMFLWTNTLIVPNIISTISSTKTVMDRLMKWTLGAAVPFLINSSSLDDCLDKLDGNDCLFLLGNIVDLWSCSEYGDHKMLVDLVLPLLQHIRSYFSDKQTTEYQHYHPLFKWSKASWGNTLHSTVFDKVINQLEYLWSRPFMDQLFYDIVHFDKVASSSVNRKAPLFKQNKRKQPLTSKGEIALFAVEVESIFSIIAFTKNLVQQLWRIMNQFGPKGHMQIYLEAAQRNEIDKEPLIDVLKIFCQACSIVFITLDDTDIFKHNTPFSPDDLIQISGFLNLFYFSLIQQPTATSTEIPPAALSFKSARSLLLQIYDLDLQHSFCPPSHWLLVSMMSSRVKSIFSSIFQTKNEASTASLFLTKLSQGDPVPLRILQLMSHTVPFDVRLKVFRDWISTDKVAFQSTHSKSITVRRNRVLLDGYQQLCTLSASAWKGFIRVSFVNELGMEEAGIDRGGPFKDFITLLTNEVFEPDFGLFAATKHNSVYPSPNSALQGRYHIELFEFIGKVIGKAMYEGILLDVQFAKFFLAKLLGRNVFLQELQELDEELWKSLTFIKHYEGNAEDLGLVFEIDEDVLGKVQSHELKYRGKHTAVNNENKIEYVYLLADYKLNQRAKEQTRAFIRGFRTVVSENWIKLFTPPELQRVLSGEDKEFDISDLRRHTEYQGGYFDQHPVIRSFWQIAEKLSLDEKKAFLKFVTGCPKPPLGGFSYLQPPFTIRMVSLDESGTSDNLSVIKSFLKMSMNKSGRLPTSSTCFNLLKLPAYTNKSILKEKLCYGKFK
ncbi:hypothetical protein RMATCC62417_15119 [Rhizopus microsporus]|nr:hypothetical protein RMATCC62417_15119 [Rhizopus microsporus]